MKYPGSNSGSGWTAQIKIGNKYLGQDGKLYKNNKQKNNNFKWQLYKKFEAKDLCWSS